MVHSLNLKHNGKHANDILRHSNETYLYDITFPITPNDLHCKNYETNRILAPRCLFSVQL